MEPFLYLAVEEPRGRIVSIGEACPNRAAHRVALFADEPLPFASISRRELAEAFFRYAYMKIRPRFAILAPIVVLLPTGDECFTSECAQHLVQAAAAAGASEVYWNRAFAEQYGLAPNKALQLTPAAKPICQREAAGSGPRS